MIELLVFLVPIVVNITVIYRRVFKAEESAIAYIKYVNTNGIRVEMLWSPWRYLTLIAYFMSPLYISLGWIWFSLASIFSIILVMFFIAREPNVKMPKISSKEFDIFINKRKKQAIWKLVGIICWIASWGMELLR